MNSVRILIVDDDERWARLLTHYVSDAGYEALFVLDGQSMMRVYSDFQPQIVLLDLGLPDDHGFELAKAIRTRDEHVGIIFLTGNTDAIDLIVGLEIGADDYLSKPVDYRELLARIRSLERRVNPGIVETDQAAGNVLEIGDLKIDEYRDIVTTTEDYELQLTTYEFKLLKQLADRAGHAQSRADLLRSLSERNWAPSDRSVDVLVVKLRKKLQRSSRMVKIVTVRGVGYKLLVETVTAASSG